MDLLGPNRIGDGYWNFRVWAPLRKSVGLEIKAPFTANIPMRRGDMGYWSVELEFEEGSRHVPMEKDEMGYWNLELELDQGAEYRYVLDEKIRRPDPASSFQSGGVHGPSKLMDHSSYRWKDVDWKTPKLKEMIIYEIHTGTFSKEGTFEGASEHLDELSDLGITAVELMPVSQFPGKRNWGYDGAYPFAVQNSYGGPDALKKFVDSCHEKGLAVILDVVYNHLGPEGNYLADFAPYFTDRISTPWGQAVNFDGEYSYGVRRYFIENALHWLNRYHVDGLRLDAIHSIFDMSPVHFIRELVSEVRNHTDKKSDKWIICENDLNDVRVFQDADRGGYGADAQWCDDFHHSVRSLVTGKRKGYFSDFGTVSHLRKALSEGYVYSWQYSGFRKRFHGSSSENIPKERFVAFIQNHDQVGNGGGGKRLSELASFEVLKMSAGILLLSPYVPLLFMGEEYGEDNPFYFFVDFSDHDLLDAVRKGRKELKEEFGLDEAMPDPAGIETFERSLPDRKKAQRGNHRILKDLYKHLIAMRKRPALRETRKESIEVKEGSDGWIMMTRKGKGDSLLVLINTSEEEICMEGDLPRGPWNRILDTSDQVWNGPGSVSPHDIENHAPVGMNPSSFAVYEKEAVR
mgnify:CR=1 FL=1